eukprot:Amastigsp_a845686_8.p4 type:complete len:204 gc:universal Amastigsp_a845686_8:778-1389(+)
MTSGVTCFCSSARATLRARSRSVTRRSKWRTGSPRAGWLCTSERLRVAALWFTRRGPGLRRAHSGARWRAARGLLRSYGATRVECTCLWGRLWTTRSESAQFSWRRRFRDEPPPAASTPANGLVSRSEMSDISDSEAAAEAVAWAACPFSVRSLRTQCVSRARSSGLFPVLSAQSRRRAWNVQSALTLTPATVIATTSHWTLV